MVSVRLTDLVCAGLSASVTAKASATAFAAAVGVPPMTPVDVNVRPAGSTPEVRIQVYGDVPPEARRDAE